MSLWKKVKRDVEEGIKKSLEFVKKESKAEKIRAEKRARAVERQPQLSRRKDKMQKELCELGSRVYALRGQRKNPLEDKKVGEIIARIKTIEQAAIVVAPKRKPAAKKTAKKAKKKAKKKTAKKRR